MCEFVSTHHLYLVFLFTLWVFFVCISLIFLRWVWIHLLEVGVLAFTLNYPLFVCWENGATKIKLILSKFRIKDENFEQFNWFLCQSSISWASLFWLILFCVWISLIDEKTRTKKKRKIDSGTLWFMLMCFHKNESGKEKEKE